MAFFVFSTFKRLVPERPVLKNLNLTCPERKTTSYTSAKKLQAYNARHFEIAEESNFIISFVDDEDELIGGIVCTIVGQWLEIDFLWAKDQERGKGLGEKLLFEAEKLAKEKDAKKRSF